MRKKFLLMGAVLVLAVFGLAMIPQDSQQGIGDVNTSLTSCQAWAASPDATKKKNCRVKICPKKAQPKNPGSCCYLPKGCGKVPSDIKTVYVNYSAVKAVCGKKSIHSIPCKIRIQSKTGTMTGCWLPKGCRRSIDGYTHTDVFLPDSAVTAICLKKKS